MNDRVLLLHNCEDCPYFRQFVENRRIQCDISEDEFGCMVQLGYGKDSFDEALLELFSQCPLSTPSEFCDDYCSECELL